MWGVYNMFAEMKCKGKNGNCKKELFLVVYDTETKEWIITCANCGHVESLNNIFSRRLKNVKSRRSREAPGEVRASGGEGDDEETDGQDFGVTVEKEVI